MMESIEKLRELCAKWRKTSITPGRNSAADEVDAIADEIEREIAERFMELPVDADGVPWHIGDMTENRNVVNGIAFDRHRAHFVSTLNDIDPSIHTHFKQRTVEDVLKEFGDWYKHVAGGCDEPGIIAKYADELRSMGVVE